MVGFSDQHAQLGCRCRLINDLVAGEGRRSAVHQAVPAAAHAAVLGPNRVEEKVHVGAGKLFNKTVGDIFGNKAAIFTDGDPGDLH